MGKSKACKNAFFFFMMELKSKQGRNFKNNEEVAKAADPLWKNMTPEQRKPYEQKAKTAKNQQGAKFTAQGVNIAVIEERENEIKTKEQQMKLDIQKTIDRLMRTESIEEHYFYIVHINNFCYSNADQRFYPAEIAVSQFSLANGVEKVFHQIIYPGPLPLGYSYEAKKNSEQTHQLPPPLSVGQDAEDNTKEMFDSFISFINDQDSGLPPIYARDQDMELITNILSMYSIDFGNDEYLVNVYSLEYLLYVLKNSCAGEQVWPTISLSSAEIKGDVYDYTMGIACEFHSLTDSPIYCSKSIVTRLAYIVCDNCCSYLSIELIPGLHIPDNAKVPASRPGTAASINYSIPDNESRSSLRPVSKSEMYDEHLRTPSSLSFVSETSTVADIDEFPPLGGREYNRRNGQSLRGGKKHNMVQQSKQATGWATNDASGTSRVPSSRPFELPSALMDGVQESAAGRSAKGRGRNLMKNMQ